MTENRDLSTPSAVDSVRDVLDELGRNNPDGRDDATLGDLRVGIDLLDRALLELLNQRVVYATIIGRMKKARGLPVYVPEREADVLHNVRAANRGPLTDDAVKRVFERIIDETRSLERRKYQDDPTDRTEDLRPEEPRERGTRG